MRVVGAMESADSAWRVEVVERRGQRFYRLTHGDEVHEPLSIATVERMLREAGVDLGELRQVSPDQIS